jgi:transcriptional regulator with GAF, ATPase, and Fis domain
MASKYYHQSAEIALMEGRLSEPDVLAVYSEKLSESDDVSHAAEFRLLLAAYSLLYNEQVQNVQSQLEGEIVRCFDANAYYYACLGYYLLVCNDASKLHDPLLAKLRQWISSADAGVPLFRALQVLLKECENGKPAEMKSWKKCLIILRDGKQHFAAAMTARHIAQRYLQEAMPRHAKSIAAHGLSFAQNLGNAALIRIFASLDEQASRMQVTASSPAFVEAIADALSNLDRSELTAQRLLELSIETSGAERGIILLASASGELRIVAEAHCDDDTLEIAKYSKQLVESSAHTSSPILIDDATADARTNKYQSIIRHNIQSIAAIPMKRDGELLGVLYLDHHSQSSLFSADDLRILSGIGDLILSVLLSTQKMGGLIRAAQVKRERVDQEQTPYIFATSSSSLKSMLREVEKVADSEIAMLITGESGTGKEVLARLIHEKSKRKDAPLVIVNSAALSPELVESELFGIAKGTATGVLARDGKISAADQGTLFLDEIGDMPRNLQSKLLRVLESNRIERVGSTKSEYVDFRLVAATNRNLKAMIAEGTFREDLYYRISKYVVHLPPLRERRGEIEYLVQKLMTRVPAHKRPTFDEQAMEALKSYAWPGNVRELWNLIERFAIVHGNATITVDFLPDEMRSNRSSSSPKQLVTHGHQKASLEAALERNNWSVSKTARSLKMPLTSLRRTLDELGIKRSS